MALINRLLQSNSSTGNNDPDVFEFLGFVAWYLFLVVCCIVPTACAYRRRRMQEGLRRNQMNSNPLQGQDAQVYFTNFRFPQRVEEREEVSLKEIQDVLQKTTMVSFTYKDCLCLIRLIETTYVSRF